MDVIIYQIARHHRSSVVCKAMYEGIRKVGDDVRITYEEKYRAPSAKIAVFYGLHGNLKRILRDYHTVGRHAIYIDLGYFGRTEGGRFSGFHKISVDGRHPTKYFMRNPHDAARFRSFGLEIEPYQTGKHILLAGMSAKASHAEGMPPESWERTAVADLRKHTDRPIIYRPKPNWTGAHKIPGAEFARERTPLHEAFANCHAVVTHHSNVAVEGLIAGVPSFSWDGVAQPLSLSDFSRIETQLYPDNRESWAADIAYCQWSLEEMAQGLPWRHLKDEGLLA